MKFQEYISAYSAAMSAVSWQRYYANVIESTSPHGPTSGGPRRFPDLINESHERAATHWEATVEKAWYENRRPYYKVWPSIIPALKNLALDIPMKSLSIRPRIIALRFSSIDRSFPSMLLCAVAESPGGLATTVTLQTDYAGESSLAFGLAVPAIIPIEASVTIERFVADFAAKGNPEFASMYTDWLRVALSILLLADDSSIIEPDVLSKDEANYGRTHDQKYIDRAVRRGKVGWNIGKAFDAMPHFRRPHFGWRHTGPGGTVPRLVPIKACIVHRQRITTVPTGYLAEDDTEIEG